MKKLTIEEKAKAYDEAIERVEDIKTGKCETRFMFTEGLFEHIFPALKESEDERIIGNIIATIHLYYGEPLEDEAKEMVAWLEKQGELVNSLSNGLDNAHERIDGLIQKNNSLIEQLEKRQGEQKPTDTEKGAKGNERKIPNSVWSEEDDKLLELSVDNLTELKNRFGKEYGRTGDCINWLKSLKDRYTWKPSDGQVKALNYVTNLMASSESPAENDYYYNVFKDLREQLKKLKE